MAKNKAQRIWYAIRCWEDCGGPEDGIISNYYWTILRAPSPTKAWNMAKAQGYIPCYRYEEDIQGFQKGIPDIRRATADEISEHIYYDIKMLWQDRKDKIEQYGPDGWVEWIKYIKSIDEA